MFNKLIASGPRSRSWLRNPTVIFVSVGIHLLLLAGVVWGTTRTPEPEPEPEPEEITYIDVTEIPPPEVEEVFEAPEPEPEASPPPAETPPTPTPPTRAPAQPRNPDPAPATEEPAGFQELDVPDVDVSGIPEPDVAAAPVRAEDFGGRGTPGGTAGGVPAPPPPPSTGGSGEGTGGGNQTYSANLVDEEAELTNRGDIARILSRNYPSRLRDAGIEGRVVVQFVVDQRGRVEPGSVKVISTSEDGFAEATRSAVSDFRFRPGKVQGRSVRQLVQIPIEWKVAR